MEKKTGPKKVIKTSDGTIILKDGAPLGSKTSHFVEMTVETWPSLSLTKQCYLTNMEILLNLAQEHTASPSFGTVHKNGIGEKGRRDSLWIWRWASIEPGGARMLAGDGGGDRVTRGLAVQNKCKQVRGASCDQACCHQASGPFLSFNHEMLVELPHRLIHNTGCVSLTECSCETR